jgi:hypothetical protein
MSESEAVQQQERQEKEHQSSSLLTCKINPQGFPSISSSCTSEFGLILAFVILRELILSGPGSSSI